MKNKKLITSILALTVTLIASTAVGCDILNELPFLPSTSSSSGSSNSTSEEVQVTQISLSTADAQKTYAVGEAFSAEGVIVTAYYSDETSKTIAISDCTVSTPDMTTEGNKTIIVSYQGKNASYSITVANPTPELKGITLNAEQAKVTYFTEDAFTAEGVVITATYSDNSTSSIKLGECTISVPDMKTVGEKTITITYEGFSASYTIQVKDHTLVNVALTTTGVKTCYMLGEEFSATGIELVGSYDSGKQAKLNAAECTISTPDMTKLGEQIISVTYGEFVKTYSIFIYKESYLFEAEEAILPDSTVIIDSPEGRASGNKHIENGGIGQPITFEVEADKAQTAVLLIGINKPDSKNFESNYTLKVNGQQVVVGNYNGNGWDGTTDGAYYDFRNPIQVIISLQEGKNTIELIPWVTGQYSNLDSIQIGTSDNLVEWWKGNLTSLSLTTGDMKKEYKVGETFSLAGLSVTANYDTGVSKNIALEKCEISTPDMTTEGTKTIRVSFKGQTATFDIVVKAEVPVVTNISVNAESAKTAYYVGDAFSAEGIAVIVNYSNGTSKTVGYAVCEVTGYDMTKAGTQTVTVTYEGETATYEIEIVEVKVVSLLLNTTKVRLVYDGVAQLSTVGIGVTGSCNNGTTQTLSIDDCAVTAPDMTTAGMKEVTVSYGEASAKYWISVGDSTKYEAENATLPIGIKIVDTPENRASGSKHVEFVNVGLGEKIAFAVESELETKAILGICINMPDPRNFEADLFQLYVNGQQVIIGKFAGNGWDGTMNGGFYDFRSTLNVAIDLRAGDNTIELVVVDGANSHTNLDYISISSGVLAEKAELMEITINSEQVKKSYFVADTFSADGLVITAKYSDETIQTVAFADCEITGYDMNTIGVQTVTVSYAGKTATYEIEVKEKIVTTATTVFEAEDAKLPTGANVENVPEGRASGDKAVSVSGVAAGEKIVFNITSSAAGTVVLGIRLNKVDPKTFEDGYKLYVNGTQVVIGAFTGNGWDGTGNGGWYDFRNTVDVEIGLVADANIIELEVVAGHTFTNLDSIEIKATGITVEWAD